jgi:hypothetical protein
MRILIGFVILTAVLVTRPAMAESKPIQLSLFPPIQLVSEIESIGGVRLSLLYGKNTYVSGLDVGLVSHATSGVSKGVQFGLVGIVDADFTGFQDTWVNVTKGKMEGFQWGLVNYAGHASGFQLGFVNYAVTMKGLQIGLLNFIKQGGQFPVFPIVNWSF